MKLIYINPQDSSVMEAQVISLLNYFQDKKTFKEVLLLQGIRNKHEKKKVKNKLASFNGKITYFKTYPNYFWFDYLNFFFLKKILKKHQQLDIDTIIHTRGEKYGVYIAKYFKFSGLPQNLLVDIRGASIEEYKNYYRINPYLKWLKIRNTICIYKTLIKLNVNVTVVSIAFQNYLIGQFDFKRSKVCVHPNISNNHFTFNKEKREVLRKEIGFGKDEIIAIMASGGSASWQKDVTIINKLLKTGVKVINLSRLPINIPGVINKYVAFNDMPSYLSASDIGILWRDKNMVNEVASPSKFSEFACNGLFVVHNGTVGIAKEYIEQSGFGIIIESEDSITYSKIMVSQNIDRKNASKIGLSYFGVDSIAMGYFETYKKILQTNNYNRSESVISGVVPNHYEK
jgi:hypothetical protein